MHSHNLIRAFAACLKEVGMQMRAHAKYMPLVPLVSCALCWSVISDSLKQ